jgi:hypothetical protein
MPEGTGEVDAAPAAREPAEPDKEGEFGEDDERPASGEDEQSNVSLQRPATGEPRVDEALARLDELAGLPVTEHGEVFEHVHRRLREVLGELDPGPTDNP